MPAYRARLSIARACGLAAARLPADSRYKTLLFAVMMLNS